MRVEVIEGDVRGGQGFQKALNDWLEDVEELIRIEHTQVIGPDTESCKFLLVVFYSLRMKPAEMSDEPHDPVPEGRRCSQCKRRPAIEGTKHCEECKAYQKKYREDRKADKNARYP